jgi:S-adenosylmethionine decarboxylase
MGMGLSGEKGGWDWGEPAILPGEPAGAPIQAEHPFDALLCRAGLLELPPMLGLHLTADLHDCQCGLQWLTDREALGAVCMKAVAAAGLQAVGKLVHGFPATPLGPGGVTATVLLAESHLCIHTWPEQRGVTLDVYVCNFGGDHSAKAHALMECMVSLFQPRHSERNELQRGRVAAGAQ